MQKQPKIIAKPINPSDMRSGSKLNIVPRKVNIDYDDINSPFFFDNNAPISAFWTGLSTMFPLGEKEFINSVLLFKDKISDKKLLAEVQDFAVQEAHHAVQHRKINQTFESLGYAVSKVESYIDEMIKYRIEHWTPEQRLSRTVCAEHVTATMAHFALTHPHSLDAAPKSLQDLLLWHSIEEIEHKSVAFDVYKHCVGDMKALRKHYRHFALIEFPLQVRGITKFLLKELGHKSTRQERKAMRKYLFGKEGLIRAVRKVYWMFNQKDFHPWQHDDSKLVEEWKVKLAPFIAQDLAA
ncbi:MAG: metal-dependent hydrolase [Gammaproteobacteria bacterium]|nr:metal-dependent hydrolase [Gammaproteobacteria bacterium]NNC96836.1 metal-dependent hydrolase [Gammaproteobacteria bacterium]NNM14087.1 metal-dependent hydrolase [Gammaproteobacteria bacterium]